MQNPEYLYHYTTVESLAMILSAKTFRFSPLSILDDKQEEKTLDITAIGKTVFISSWTSDERESIPMWNMYSKLEAGVRIKAKCNLFEGAKTLPNRTIEISGYPHTNGEWDLFPPELKEVKYSDKEDDLFPKIVKGDGQIWDQSKFGIYKNTAWTFQNEWRYIVRFWPSRNYENTGEDAETIYKKFVLGLPSYVYMKILQESFETMEITLSPKISSGNKILVSALVKEYAPSIKVHNSILNDCIR